MTDSPPPPPSSWEPPPSWGVPPPPPPPPGWPAGTMRPPPPPPVAGARRWPAALGVAIVGLLVVAAVAIATGGLDSGPAHPDAWDPRVADLAEFLEDERDLDFDHPVYVDFLSAEEYTKETTSEEADLADEDRSDLERYAAQLRALGVASGELDLFAAYNSVSDSGTLAFYDPATERVRVRGTEMTVGMQVTLVHELTHALQHQHFDLDRLYDDEVDSSASTAYRALIEGDALRMEEAYVLQELTPEQQEEYDAEYATQLDESIASTEDVPPYVSASFGVPYLLGQPLVVMLDNEGGNRSVNDAFEDPPSTEEHLFDPASFRGEESDEEVGLGLDDDVELLDDGPFGAASWYLILAERIDPKVAFAATLGWAGDAFAGFEHDGNDCVRAVFAGDSSTDEAEMTDALTQWAAAMPGGAAEVIDVEGNPGVEACDPGEDVDMQLTGRVENALFVPSLWGYLVADAATELDVDGTRCYAQHVLDGLTFEEITDPEGAVFNDERFPQLLQAAYETCV